MRGAARFHIKRGHRFSAQHAPPQQTRAEKSTTSKDAISGSAPLEADVSHGSVLKALEALNRLLGQESDLALSLLSTGHRDKTSTSTRCLLGRHFSRPEILREIDVMLDSRYSQPGALRTPSFTP